MYLKHTSDVILHSAELNGNTKVLSIGKTTAIFKFLKQSSEKMLLTGAVCKAAGMNIPIRV